jgi:outer membrane protein assembly factor BamB
MPFTFQNVPLIAAGTDAGLVCVDARSGALVFQNSFSAKNTANCPTPAYADGYVFWANGYNKGGICMQLSAAGNKVAAQQAWTTSDMVCHHGGYIIDNGYIYGDNGGGVTCLELKAGKTMWKNRGVGKGSVLWADDMLYLFGEGGGKAGLATCSPEGMQMKGTFSVAGSGPSWAHPVVIGGRLYLRYDANLYCYDVKAK